MAHYFLSQAAHGNPRHLQFHSQPCRYPPHDILNFDFGSARVGNGGGAELEAGATLSSSGRGKSREEDEVDLILVFKNPMMGMDAGCQ